MKYYLIGNVNKKIYKSYYDEIYDLMSENSAWKSFRKLNFETMNVEELFMECLRVNTYEFTKRNIKAEDSKYYKYKDIEEYKNLRRIEIVDKLPIVTEFDYNEDIDVITTERQFKDGDIIKYKEEDYQVKYKYNKDLERHELYINYEIKAIEDKNLKRSCENKLEELNKKIKEYNKEVDAEEVEIDERFEEHSKLNTMKIKDLKPKKLWNRIKKFLGFDN